MMKNNKYIEGYDNFCLSGGLCGYPLEKSMILDRFENTKAEGPGNYAMHKDTQFQGDNWKFGLVNTPGFIKHCMSKECNAANPKNVVHYRQNGDIYNSSSCNGCNVCQTTTCDPANNKPDEEGVIKLLAICKNCDLNIPIINQPTTMKQ